LVRIQLPRPVYIIDIINFIFLVALRRGFGNIKIATDESTRALLPQLQFATMTHVAGAI
jgi:uncharacterized membrane protein